MFLHSNFLISYMRFTYDWVIEPNYYAYLNTSTFLDFYFLLSIVVDFLMNETKPVVFTFKASALTSGWLSFALLSTWGLITG